MVKMETWLVYGLIAAFAFGVNAIIYKFGLRNGIDPFFAGFIFSLGVSMVFLAAMIFKKSATSLTFNDGSLVFFAGVIWAIGFLAVTLGFAQNFNVSKIAIVYSSNVIVTVLLSIVLLKELSSGADFLRVAVGMAFVVAGVVVTSLK
ncbi:EamA family transporter [Candidatus Woesearchaeota archaeon]|nr:EamA family transporter [Candidatus Woesearchaeota archaeon]